MAAAKAMEPNGINVIFAAALNRGDIDTALSLYEPDADLIMPDGQRYIGLTAIRGALEGFTAVPGVLEAETVSTMVYGDIALLRSQWRLRTTGPDGKPLELTGKSAEVVRRQADGSWRFIIDNAARL